jgi:hypothetical protein
VILASYYFGGKLIRKVLISELNEQLNVQATVNAVNLNGLKTFPYLSLELTNVRINESAPFYKQHLLQAQSVVVTFNPFTLLSGNNEIDKVSMSKGAVRLYTDRHGETNFDLFKPDSSSEDKSLNIDLKQVVLSNFRCIYVDETQDQSLNFETDNIEFSGKFTSDTYQLKTKGDGLFDHLTLGGTDYVIGKKIKLDLALDIDQKINAYHIEKGEIGMDNLRLDVTGDVLLVGSEPDLDLTFKGNNINVQSVVSILPNKVAYALRDLRSSGQINVDGTVLGRFTEDAWPSIDVTFGFSNASITSKSMGLSCQKINLTGTLQNPDTKKLNLDLDLQELNMKKSSVSGQLTITDLMKPNIKFALKGLLDFTDIQKLVSQDKGDDFTGKSLFNLDGELTYNDSIESIDFNTSTVNGDIEIRDAYLRQQSKVLIDHLFAKSRVAGDKLTNVEVKGELWKNDVQFTGSINHWQTFLANRNRLVLEGDLKSDYLNLNFNADSTAVVDTTALVNLDYNIDTDITFEVATLNWSSLKAKNLYGKLRWDDKGMVFRNVIFDAWKGTNHLDGELLQYEDRFELHSTSISEKVALESLLDEFNNFGQSEFTSEILNGILTTTIDLNMQFDRQFNVIEDSLVALADFLIENGRLKDYQNMESLSSFVELEDLQDIRFKELQNTIEIHGRTIYIPSMVIENNAMNLEIAGTHSFDNYMNYRLKIRVTELLANKSGWVKRKKERQLDESADGGLSAYILMVGTPDNLKIKYDRKAVKEKIKQEVKKERKAFFQELKKEIKREKTTTDDTKKVQWDE